MEYSEPIQTRMADSKSGSPSLEEPAYSWLTKSVFILITLVLCFTTFFPYNNSIPLEIMEARNLVAAHEMAVDGHWLVPTMNAELRLEKPPLPTWVAGVLEMISPHNLSLQRGAAGVMGLLWTLFVGLCAKYLFRRKDMAWISVLVFLTCYHVLYMGRTASWDIFCHTFMMGAIYSLLRLFYDDTRQDVTHPWRWALGAGVFMGLSFLSKGPVSFYALLLPFLVAALIYQRPHMHGKWLPMLTMPLVAIIIGGWWYLYLYLIHPEAFAQVMGQESGAWLNHNVRPWYYYIQSVIEVDVWVFWFLAALCIPYWMRRLSVRREYLFLTIWSLGILLVLSVIPEKKIRYLLPFMAPFALWITSLLAHFIHAEALNRWEQYFFRFNGYLIALVLLAVPFLLYFFGVEQGALTIWQALLYGALYLILAAGMAWSAHHYSMKGMLAVIALTFMIAEGLLWPSLSSLWTNPYRHSIHEVAGMESVKGIPMYHPADEDLRMQVVYEACRPIRPLQLTDEAAFKRSLPMLLVSHVPARQLLSPDMLQQLQVVEIGVYEDSRHRPDDRHYTNSFVSHVTYIRSIEP